MSTPTRSPRRSRRAPAALRAPARALFRLPVGVVRLALVVRVVDEWWSYLPAGSIGDLRRDLGIEYAQAGWLLALLTVGGIAGSPIGALADRGHRRLLAVCGNALMVAGLLAYAAAPPFAVLAVASFVLGASSDIVVRPLESALAELAGDDLDRVLGRQHLITWFGDLIGPVILAVGAATALGWRGAFAVSAAVIAAYGVLLALTEFPDPPPAADDEPSLGRSALALARHPQVLLLAVIEAVLIPLDEAFLGFAVARLVASGAGAWSQAVAVGLVIGGIAGAALVSRVGLSAPVRRWGGPLLAAGAVATAAGPPMPVQLLAMAAMGAGMELVWSRVHHHLLTVVPGRSGTVPTVVGILSFPALVVPAGIGWLADRSGLTAALLASAALAVPLLAALAGVRDRRE